MNQKAQIATVVAVLLGIFLVVVTAIKFDWVGMVVRGESIFKFGDEEKVEPNNQNDQNQTEEEPVEDDDSTTGGVLVSLSCNLDDQTTDLKTTSFYDFQFIDDQLVNSTQNLLATYTLDTTKTAFDQYIKTYQDMAVSHSQSPSINVTEQSADKSYTFTEDISYSDETVSTVTPAVPFNQTMGVSEGQNVLTQQGYTCTQSYLANSKWGGYLVLTNTSLFLYNK